MRFFLKKVLKNFAGIKKGCNFANANGKQPKRKRAFSSAGSEHLPYKQRVGGSNPSTPTSLSLTLLIPHSSFSVRDYTFYMFGGGGIAYLWNI